jgi:hypothetical protein
VSMTGCEKAPHLLGHPLVHSMHEKTIERHYGLANGSVLRPDYRRLGNVRYGAKADVRL